MTPQTRTLIWLELCNIFGLNVLRHSKTKADRKKLVFLFVSYSIVLLVLLGYMIGVSYTFIMFELADIIPTFLILIASLCIFFLGTLKAGSILFRKDSYEILCSLPITQAAIVISRLLRMYVEGIWITLAVLLPGFAVYAWFQHPSASFYLLGILSIIFVPCIPIISSILIGTLVTGIASRMKHKSLVSALLSLLAVLALLFALPQFSAQLVSIDGNMNQDALKALASFAAEWLKQIYPPATFMGTAIIEGNFLLFLILAGISLSLFAAATALITTCFHSICQKLHGTLARHNYHMEQLKETSILSALCKREFKRYFSSSIYVINTIIGPVMGVLFSGSLLFVDTELIATFLPASSDISDIAPFLLASIFCIMTSACVSISMEGKNFWIIKSLPLTTKNKLDAKLLMNLLLILPFYLITQILLTLALKPGLLSLFWQLIIPIIILLFSCTYGIAINLHFPVLNWENETGVVKQSTSAILGGLGAFFFSILCTACILLIPEPYTNLAKLGLCILILGITAWLYQHNNKIDLKQL